MPEQAQSHQTQSNKLDSSLFAREVADPAPLGLMGKACLCAPQVKQDTIHLMD